MEHNGHLLDKASIKYQLLAGTVAHDSMEDAILNMYGVSSTFPTFIVIHYALRNYYPTLCAVLMQVKERQNCRVGVEERFDEIDYTMGYYLLYAL